jgi:hypothetical protein
MKCNVLILKPVHINPSFRNIHFLERVIIVADLKLLGSTHTQVGWSTQNQRMPYFVFNAMFLL